MCVCECEFVCVCRHSINFGRHSTPLSLGRRSRQGHTAGRRSFFSPLLPSLVLALVFYREKRFSPGPLARRRILQDLEDPHPEHSSAHARCRVDDSDAPSSNGSESDMLVESARVPSPSPVSCDLGQQWTYRFSATSTSFVLRPLGIRARGGRVVVNSTLSASLSYAGRPPAPSPASIHMRVHQLRHRAAL